MNEIITYTSRKATATPMAVISYAYSARFALTDCTVYIFHLDYHLIPTNTDDHIFCTVTMFKAQRRWNPPYRTRSVYTRWNFFPRKMLCSYLSFSKNPAKLPSTQRMSVRISPSILCGSSSVNGQF